jgi:hypothetical protein
MSAANTAIGVCRHCFNSERLGEHIKKIGTLGTCPTCGFKNTKVVAAAKLQPYFKPLARLYRPAVEGKDYKVDKRGRVISDGDCEDLYWLVQEDWDVFSKRVNFSSTFDIISELWPDYEDAKYVDSDEYPGSPDHAFKRLAKQVMHDRRFFPPEGGFDLDELVGRYLRRFKMTVTKLKWYRARKHPRSIIDRHPKPFDRDKIGAPPPEEVFHAGRANPAGIAYLYLASSWETAIAEVRGEPGDLVSIGTFLLADGLSIINLVPIVGDVDPFEHDDLGLEVECRKLLKEFGRWLSRHVRSEEHELDYVVTQYLAEYIRSRGYDGIRFKSALSTGTNLALFTPGNAAWVDTKQHEITTMSIEYGFHEVKDRPRRVHSRRRVARRRSDSTK